MSDDGPTAVKEREQAAIWIIVLLSYATRWWSRSFPCVGADAQGQDEASAQPQQQDNHDEQEDFFPWLARVTNTVGFGSELPSGPPEWFPLYDCAHARDKEMNSALTNSVRINWLVNFARSLPDTAQCEDFFLVDDAPPEETNSAAASIQANENTAYQQCGSIFLAPAVIRVAPPAQSLRLVFQKFGNALANLHWNLRHYCYILNFLFRHFGNVQDFAKLDDTKIQREQLARVGGGQGEDAGKRTTTPEECNYWGSEKNENQLDAQHLHDADLAYLGYRSRDTLPAKAFRLDSHALANLMARWQDLAYPFLSKHHGLMERRMRAQRERDQKENQKLIDEIRSSGSEATPTNSNSSNSLSWSSSASGLHATGGTDQEEEIAYVFRILVYHCDLLSRKFAESKYIGSLFGSYNTNRYFARTPRATHRFVENASKDALARYEVRGSFNFTNLAYKLSADVSWAKRAFKQQVEEVANILDGFDEDSDQPVLGPQHDRANQSELQKKFPHMMREYAYYARTLGDSVLVAYDEMVQYFDSYYRVYATNMAAENAFQILENGYDIDLEVRHARKGYTIACQREVYKAFVRASQNMQDLNEPTAMARRVVAKDERFVAEKLVKRWSDPGEHQNQCYRDPLFAADIQRHPLLGGGNHS
eukprot:g19889.t1